jgi:methionyl-tRNA formyltransferase
VPSRSRRCRRSVSRTAPPRRALARLAFLGTPPVAAATLVALLDAGHEVCLVVSAPDQRRTRRGAPIASPVKAVALERGVPVAARVGEVVDCGAELGLVVAFGQLIRPDVLDALSMVNLHSSLLPRWRGAAPVEWAILAGDPRTGVSLMALEAGLDTGPVYAMRAVEIGAEESASALTTRLGELGIEMLLERLAAGPEGLGTPVAQHGETTYARKRTVAECELDFTSSALVASRVVRAGRAWTTFRGERLLVHRARPHADGSGPPGVLADGRVATRDGALELVEVQASGRGVLDYAAWAAGARPAPGERLQRLGPLDEDGGQ